MHVAMLNPQGNFDPQDSYWTQHPDFGGQLVYVKEISLAMAARGHTVDILTRCIVDPDWPEFSAPIECYAHGDGVRIVRVACGPPTFLPKEQLWPHLGGVWVQGILDFYRAEDRLPDVFCAHYADGGVCGAILEEQTGVAFTFTGHSLGAQKLDKLEATRDNLAELDARFVFRRRLCAERVAMNHAARIVVSTGQEQREQYAHRAYRAVVDARDDRRFAVVPPGVNRDVFSDEPGALDAAIQARIEQALARDLPPERRGLPQVLCSSRLDPKKNHIALVKAFVASRELRARANLAIVVRGLEVPLRERPQLGGSEQTLLDEIVETVEAHALWPAVTTFALNSQAELAAAYRCLARRHSVFALSALYEPFGLAPLEAMSCGLPAVVTRNGGPSESLYDEATDEAFGVLIDPTDPVDIARGLLEVVASDGAWQRYRQAGLERVTSRYTWDRAAQGYLDVFVAASRQKSLPTRVPIPPYFTHPSPGNDLSLENLAALYFGS